MDVLDRLEGKCSDLISKVRLLEEENQRLSEGLDHEKQVKKAVLEKIDHLLDKLQEVKID